MQHTPRTPPMKSQTPFELFVLLRFFASVMVSKNGEEEVMQREMNVYLSACKYLVIQQSKKTQMQWKKQTKGTMRRIE